MDQIHHQRIQALNKCTFLPGSWPKRFVRSLATYPADKELTEAQERWLTRIAWMWRNQLSLHGKKELVPDKDPKKAR